MSANPEWEQYEYANVADSAIVDRENYERECLRQLQRAGEFSPEWVKRECELLDARLMGHFPDTQICVRISVPGWSDEVDEEWPIWEDEGRAMKDGASRLQRWTPKHLVLAYVGPLLE